MYEQQNMFEIMARQGFSVLEDPKHVLLLESSEHVLSVRALRSSSNTLAYFLYCFLSLSLSMWPSWQPRRARLLVQRRTAACASVHVPPEDVFSQGLLKTNVYL